MRISEPLRPQAQTDLRSSGVSRFVVKLEEQLRNVQLHLAQILSEQQEPDWAQYWFSTGSVSELEDQKGWENQAEVVS